ncbi:hypothetical protein H6A65_01825 [Mediterraneibacter glycyrrhizinilyticus]|nr:hypothetical protein [Mediterraneibacter glycyrrhizinilyticus]
MMRLRNCILRMPGLKRRRGVIKKFTGSSS